MDLQLPLTVSGVCGVCPTGCVVDVDFEQGRLLRLKPQKGHARGIVCPRGTRAAEIVYSSDRLLYPQRRVGARGEGRFERCSWEEAFGLMVDALQEIAERDGPEALCLYTGRGNFEFGLNETFAPAGTVESSANALLFPFGSPNASGVGSLCYVSYGLIAPRSCFGASARDLYEDLEQAQTILVWGANPVTDSAPSNLLRLKAAKARGAEIVVIDHRRSGTAKALRADWVGVRPGSDGALALGLAHVLVNESLYDQAFVADWTHGFEAYRAYLQAFTPEEVERLTWVPAERVRSLARQLGKGGGLSILMYTGLEYSNSGVQAIRAVLCLQALLGALDTPGGKLFDDPERTQTSRNLTAAPVGVEAIGAREFPLFYEVRREAHASLLPKAILESDPYPVRGMIISGSSILTSWPRTSRWREALQALDFLAVVNRTPTADCAYADLLLPATTLFEIESYLDYGGQVQLRERLLEPLGEARNDAMIFSELAARLGYGEIWPQSEQALIADALLGTGIELAELRQAPGRMLPFKVRPRRYRKYESGGLRRDGQPGFETPTGRFEFASQWFLSHGYEPLPCYSEPSEGPHASPLIHASYPLVFNSGARIQGDFRSQHHNIPSLLKLAPWPLVHLHSEDARTRAICEGDLVELSSPRGRVRFRALVDEEIVRGAVEANMGGGGPLGPEGWQQANVNDLTDAANYDPISGFPVFKALLCQVERLPDAEQE